MTLYLLITTSKSDYFSHIAHYYNSTLKHILNNLLCRIDALLGNDSVNTSRGNAYATIENIRY
jgi:hypothetical protein